MVGQAQISLLGHKGICVPSLPDLVTWGTIQPEVGSFLNHVHACAQMKNRFPATLKGLKGVLLWLRAGGAGP